MKPVILAEKPSQGKAYADAFSVKGHQGYIEILPNETFINGAYITWGVGHLVELKEPKSYDTKWAKWSLASLPILPDHYEFQVAKGKSKQFNIIKKLVLATDTVINACDVDREGSNIFYSIYNHIGAKKQTIKRLWINSLEIDEVRKGFANLHNNEKDLLLYEEAKSRQISDWIVGMNASRLYSLLLQKRGIQDVFSIGRVQSPTVFLIYQRQLEIEQFKAEAFFEIQADFTAANGTYKGKAKAREAQKSKITALLDKHEIKPDTPGVVSSVKNLNKRTLPPLLHSLSTLQATANRLWKVSPANVLKAMQSLYEKKLVTYPRTDARHITTNEFSYIKNQIEKYQELINQPFKVLSTRPKKRFVDNAKVEEHHALIPTKNIPAIATLNKLSTIERNLYEEVMRTTLAMFHSDYLYTETKITTDVAGLAFYTSGKTERDKGWKALFEYGQRKNKKQPKTLPILTENELTQSKIEIIEGKTTPPKAYTEGQLIQMMKTCGRLVDDKAETEILKSVEGIGTEATRSGIIETIKKHKYIKVTKNIVSITDKGRVLCQAIDGTLLSSPSMTAKWETYLQKIGNGEGTKERFLGSMAKFIHHLLEEVPKTMQTKKFDAKLTANASTYPRGRVRRVASCPSCKNGTILSLQGFYGCSNYKSGCKQTFPGIFLQRKVTATQVKHLCENGETKVLKGFVSKSGNEFSAKLLLVNGKLKLEY